jgi:hypothetical protein
LVTLRAFGCECRRTSRTNGSITPDCTLFFIWIVLFS